MLARDLEAVPRRQIEYRGTALPEMDLDAVLARRPQLVLVDELAHTNAPGSRHSKRYLDVEELLAAGIDVYTTLNIQHVESLNDVVAQITGVIVREKIPDGVLDEADEIELVDLPPQELVAAAATKAKSTCPDRPRRAMQKFFRLGNLTALREVAMRRAAERIDGQMRAYMRTRAIPGPWPAADRLLVCVSPSPGSERLIHATRRLASHFNAQWFALYVETPGHARLSACRPDRRLARHLQLAQDLGARVRTLPGSSVAETVIQYARQAQRDQDYRRQTAALALARILVSGSIVDQIIRHSRDIDVYVITAPLAGGQTAGSRGRGGRTRPWRRLSGQPGPDCRRHFACPAPGPLLSPTNLAMLYLAVEVIAAMYLGRGPSVLAAVLGVLAFDFFFVPARITFVVGDSQYVLTFIGLFLVGIVISELMDRVRKQAKAAERREAQATQLVRAKQRSGGCCRTSMPSYRCLLAHVSETFGRQAAVLLPGRRSGCSRRATGSCPGAGLRP